ncbi:NAD(P)/FAD-dependent oxidoreductase [Saccharopolyspora elongata]|uniref:NAD(P)/FAD-dependent oxidoreductase n=1 Tax=Saccharopolyspora elongata TaxID=2530387 RepID=A0A4R4XSS3_9PSEU|nr:NAD(P)/FAD-dependent oxidoreductase [Saccharopolyspora elongata]TDD34568.1 NAD(P)/FAD-dependent oxidoreductase [Saccharopolyspora elongata]
MLDVIVIGGGPAGLSAALVLGRQRRRVLVADSGQVRNAPADEMHMYLSRDGFSPHELLALGRAELAAYPGVEVRQGQVSSVSGGIDDFTVEFADGSRERARRLILATGQMDEPYDIPGVPERFGRSIFHCPFCHGWEASGKTLAVLGRDVPQVMLGLYLADRYSEDVVVVTHGAHELPDEVIAKLLARGVQVRTEPLVKVTGELDGLQLHFADGSVLERQAMFHRAPTRQRAPFAADLGCAILEDGCVQVDELQATTVPGVFSAGDMARVPAVPDALTLVSQAAADGVRAAVWLEQGLFRATLADS